MQRSFVAGCALALLSAAARGQSLADPSAGILELVTPDPAEQAKLDAIDGLAFDARGNLLGVREVVGAGGGIVHVDTASGAVTELVPGISRADQIALHASGDLFVTSEVSPESTTDRIFRLTVAYDAQDVPLVAGTTATSVATSIAIVGPEGLVVLDASSAYGGAGDLIVAEDATPGRLLVVDPSTGATAVLASGLARPEGMAFGDFGGAATPALYVAETTNHRVLRVEANGAVSTLGTPAAVGLTSPDNLEFGPDGFLYVTEDRPAPSSRVLRIAPDGTHEVFATGFGQAQGMIFDPANGDLYLAEQDLDRIWRVRFVTPPSAFCDASDGALASCPCANPGAPDTGCDNAAGTGGVHCDVSFFDPALPGASLLCGGYPAMGAPTVVLIRSPALLATPATFGDGLRCVAAPVVRLASTTAFAGASGHAFGHGAGPGSFHYQAWYRNTPAGYCTPDAFNLSAGVTLVWP